MDIKSIKISHFRGIRQFDWQVAERFVCLIAPGDSTKTTILDVVELALTLRRNVSFDDADFYNANTESSISIEITLGEIPSDLLSDTKFGYLVKKNILSR